MSGLQTVPRKIFKCKVSTEDTKVTMGYLTVFCYCQFSKNLKSTLYYTKYSSSII